MALYYNLPVYKDCYDLMLLIFKKTKVLPREYKFTSGEKLKNEALNLMVAIYEATKSENEKKLDSIETARRHLEMIRLVSRILKDLNIWSVASLIELNIKIEVVSKQLSQWSTYIAGVK